MLPETAVPVSPELATALWFSLAVLFMDRFDITLPRGDSIGVSGALVAAGVLVAGPLRMAPLALTVLVLAHLGRPDDARERLPAAFLARVAALAFAATAVWGFTALGSGLFVRTAELLFVSLGYLSVEVAGSQVLLAARSNRRLWRLLTGNFRRQAPLIAAQASASTLAAITYPRMQAWSLVLVVALLLLIRQSMASLLEIRETYRATVEVLVEAAEGQDGRIKGHAERAAQIARTIAYRLGFNSVQIERISYAALLHDIAALSSDTGGGSPSFSGGASGVLEDAAFFDDVLPVLRICDGLATDADLTEANLTMALLVALSSDIDVAAHPDMIGAHEGAEVSHIAPRVGPGTKARVVAAAIELGYRIPAVE